MSVSRPFSAQTELRVQEIGLAQIWHISDELVMGGAALGAIARYGN
jgi:hypothetical protein